MSKTLKNLDPLFTLFERYLMTRSYDDSEKFMRELAKEYMAYLDSTPAHVPFSYRKQLLEDLEGEIKDLLTRKLCGVIDEQEFINYGQVIKVETIKAAPKRKGKQKALPAAKKNADTELFETLNRLLLSTGNEPDETK